MQVDDAAWMSLLMSLFAAAMALSIVIATFYFIRSVDLHDRQRIPTL